MYRASLVAQTEKNLSAMWETWVRSLGWKDLLEEGLATHSRILAWRIPWTEKSVTPTTHGVTRSQTQLSDQHSIFQVNKLTSYTDPTQQLRNVAVA